MGFLFTSKEREPDIYTLITFRIELDTLIHLSFRMKMVANQFSSFQFVEQTGRTYLIHITREERNTLIKRERE